jgi:hypothetical protein
MHRRPPFATNRSPPSSTTGRRFQSRTITHMNFECIPVYFEYPCNKGSILFIVTDQNLDTVRVVVYSSFHSLNGSGLSNPGPFDHSGNLQIARHSLIPPAQGLSVELERTITQGHCTSFSHLIQFHKPTDSVNASLQDHSQNPRYSRCVCLRHNRME